MSETITKYRAPALERGLDIIELLSRQSEPMSKKEIAESLGRSVNELFRMLNILEARGYVQTSEESGKYALTLKTFELSNQHPPIERLLYSANDEMQFLSEKTQQSCHLCILFDGAMLVVAKQDSPYKMGFSIRLSARIDIHGSGSGFVVLAYKTHEQRRKLLEQGHTSPIEIENVLSQLNKVKGQGYFVGASPQISGITNISYPVFNPKKQVEAALTMPFLTMNSDSLHHQVVNFEDSRKAVAVAADNLTKAIGGRAPENEID
ncbi:IclR family transcriptional regulator [Polycladidibacter stylochi]|uniref:IclR family transcriptional regulator n=1 Tax=Polycladidibacter stylochi TaxID=1807766 RepID=UPI00082FDC8A|nr:IclR family transcriptional regulator [Pseudovibrio stylochi]